MYRTPFATSQWENLDTSQDTQTIRSTLSYEFKLAESEQQLLWGYDYTRQNIKNRSELQHFTDQSYIYETTEEWAYDNQSFRDYWLIGGDEVNFYNDTLDYPADAFPTNPNDWPGGVKKWARDYDEAPALMLPRVVQDMRSMTHALWMALQGNYMDGRLRTLTGLRYDAISITAKQIRPDFGELTPTESGGRFSLVSPSLGALFWVNDNIAVFANYSKSIESPSGWSTTPKGESVPPTIGTGVEFGFKFDAFDERINGALMAFSITRENDTTGNSRAIAEAYYRSLGDADPKLWDFDVDDPSDPGNIITEDPMIDPITGRLENGRYSPSGGANIVGVEIDSKGLEADLYFNPTKNLTISACYAYTVAEYTKDPLNLLIGRPIKNTSKHSATLTARYSFDKDSPLKGWKCGLSAKFRSRPYAGRFYEDNWWRDSRATVKVDGVTVPNPSFGMYVAGVPDGDPEEVPAEGVTLIELDSETGNIKYDGVDPETGAKLPVTVPGTVNIEPKYHDVYTDWNINTTTFVGWSGQLFKKGRKAPKYDFQLTVNNLFDDVRIVGTGIYTKSRTIGFKAGVTF